MQKLTKTEAVVFIAGLITTGRIGYDVAAHGLSVLTVIAVVLSMIGTNVAMVRLVRRQVAASEATAQ